MEFTSLHVHNMDKSGKSPHPYYIYAATELPSLGVLLASHMQKYEDNY